MNDFKESVMIALLPTTTEWSRIELPHLTLVYAGEKKDLKFTDFNSIAKDASSIASLARPLTLPVLSVEVFGDQDKVDVFKLRPSSELLAMRSFVERWNASEFPFNPHVTIGPTGMPVGIPPTYIVFDRIMVGWGNERLDFLFRR